MPRATMSPKAETFNFRVDPGLKAAFARATEAADRPAAQVLREFMRAYVQDRERHAFEIEAARQSRQIAARSRDTISDEARSLDELGDLLNEDETLDGWSA